MKPLLLGDLDRYRYRTNSFIIRIFENQIKNSIKVGYGWGDKIDIGIRLPAPKNAILNRINIQTELLTIIKYVSNENKPEGTIPSPQIVRGSVHYREKLHLSNPYNIVQTDTTIRIGNGSCFIELSRCQTDWIETLTFLAPIIT